MVTAKGYSDDLETAMYLFAHNYINKPWAHGKVGLRVQWAITAVERRRLRAEVQFKQQRLAA